MIWISALLAALSAAAGVRYLLRLRAARSSGRTPRVDDAALRRIIETGVLPAGDDEPLDLREAARAEEEFWNESWDEPEEYRK